eukprot:GHVR01140642.1.p1 GENE.GHVR01140642.1~~GHVR01140642.1.p1  ORF type:complete len:301 (+),score=46.89 GHVR01140642.1:25-903(+)
MALPESNESVGNTMSRLTGGDEEHTVEAIVDEYNNIQNQNTMSRLTEGEIPKGESVSHTGSWSDVPVNHACGGLTVNGICCGKGTWKECEIVSTVNYDSKLRGPTLVPSTNKKSFFCKISESNFEKIVEKYGHSTYENGIRFGDAQNNDNMSISTSNEYNYESLIIYSVVPLASNLFDSHELHLTDNALNELKMIEDISETEAASLSFFQRFGTHVNRGPIHYGGIFWWKVYAEGFPEDQREEIKNVLDVYVNECVHSTGCLAEDNFIASETEGKSELSSKVFTSVTKTGGP